MCGQILVGWDHSQNDCSLIFAVLAAHIGGDLFDVFGLLGVSKGNEGDSGEIDDGEVGALGGVDGQLYGSRDDVLLLPGGFVGEQFDRLAHLVKIGESLFGDLPEDGPGSELLLKVDESELKGTTRDDTIASRKEVEANDVFEERGLAGALHSEDADAGEGDVVLDTDISEVIN